MHVEETDAWRELLCLHPRLQQDGGQSIAFGSVGRTDRGESATVPGSAAATGAARVVRRRWFIIPISGTRRMKVPVVARRVEVRVDGETKELDGGRYWTSNQ